MCFILCKIKFYDRIRILLKPYFRNKNIILQTFEFSSNALLNLSVNFKALSSAQSVLSNSKH